MDKYRNSSDDLVEASTILAVDLIPINVREYRWGTKCTLRLASPYEVGVMVCFATGDAPAISIYEQDYVWDGKWYEGHAYILDEEGDTIIDEERWSLIEDEWADACFRLLCAAMDMLPSSTDK
jgi:hypothetical protein